VNFARLQIADCRLQIHGLGIADWDCRLPIGIADWIADWDCRLAIVADWGLPIGDC
jgi:hypothetical protein